MLSYLFSFRPWDICLIILFILFSVSIITGLIICNSEQLAKAACRKMERWIIRLEAFRAQMQDDIPFDATWMNYEKWKETRP